MSAFSDPESAGGLGLLLGRWAELAAMRYAPPDPERDVFCYALPLATPGDHVDWLARVRGTPRPRPSTLSREYREFMAADLATRKQFAFW